MHINKIMGKNYMTVSKDAETLLKNFCSPCCHTEDNHHTPLWIGPLNHDCMPLAPCHHCHTEDDHHALPWLRWLGWACTP